MNVFVIGGTGFLGLKCCSLLSQNDFIVRAYSPSAGRTILPERVIGISGFIADKGEMKKHIEWADIIIHLVSTTNPKTSFSDPYHDISSNLLPMVQLLELMKDHENKKIIFSSSGGAVYGKTLQYPINEEHPKKPITSYGLVKSAIEDYILYYHYNFGIPYLIVRPANVYGPKLRSIGEQGIISTLIQNGLHKKPTQIWANPKNVRDYIYVDDSAQGILQLIQAGAEGTFNLGSGKGYTLHEIIDAVQKQFEDNLQTEITELIINDAPKNVLDISKISELTNWTPLTSLEEGIERTISFLKKNNA